MRVVVRRGVRAGAGIEGVRLDQMLLERRDRRERLERRAGRIRGVERAVERRVILVESRRSNEPLRLELAGRNAAGVDGRVVRRRGGEREDRAVLRAHGNDRAAVGRPLALVAGGLDAVVQRVLGGELQAGVDGEADSLPRLRLGRQGARAARTAEGIDADARRTGDAEEVLVVGRLDSRLPDHVGQRIAVLPEGLQLRR